jgi:hypothetical protein
VIFYFHLNKYTKVIALGKDTISCVFREITYKKHAQMYNILSSTLNRMAEVAHPSECHPRVMLSGEDAHEGKETQDWKMAESP